MKTRDRVAVAVLRSALAAIDNAEAVDGPATTGEPLAIELIPTGAGATEVARRVLTEAQVEAVVRAEVAEHEAAAAEYDGANRQDRAERLRTEAALLSTHLADRG